MTALVTATGLSVRHRRLQVLRDVDLTIRADDSLVLTGRSGSGKTTLVLALAGIIVPDAGRIERRPGLTVGVAFQAPSLLPDLTALQNVALPLRLRGVGSSEAYARAAGALARLGVEDVAAAIPAAMSGGQQQRVALARAMAGEPELLLADEPTGALDRGTGATIVAELVSWRQERGAALVVATHDPEVAAALNREIGLDDGRLVMAS